MSANVHFGDGSSGPLTRRFTGRTSLQQQGSISWVDLVNTTISGTVGVLSRMSAAGVDPYTAVVGQTLCTKFWLSQLGRGHVVEALSQLRSFGSLSKALWFGFGLRSVVRTLAETEEGGTCVALCAALSECYHDYVGAEILVEMAKSSKAPDELMPSILQWKALLRSCAGVFASSSFSTRAETYMQFYPYGTHLGLSSGDDYMRSRFRGISGAKSIAEALLAIGQVSRRELESVTIIGHADAGWLAAVAEWLFDLSIDVVDIEGALIYKNRVDEGNVQLRIVFEQFNNPNKPILQTTGKTYRLDDATVLIRQEVPGTRVAAVVSGRLPWDKVLYSGFGSDFKRLMENTQAFGGAIGNAARIFKAISHPEEDIHDRYRAQCRLYCDASYGQGFITNIVQWFPELGGLRTQMDVGARLSLTDARANYEANLSIIKSACNCERCQTEDDEDEVVLEQEKFCCVVLAETIIDIARCLSGMSVASDLCLTRVGLEIFYARHLNNRFGKECYRRYLEEMGPILYVMDLDRGYGGETEDIRVVRLLRALQLFGGRTVVFTSEDVSAASENGICAYLSILADLSDDDQSIGRVTIVPGRIELHGKAYNSLEDVKLDNETRYLTDHNREVTTSEVFSASYEDISVTVEEKAEALQISFDFPSWSHGYFVKQRIGPALLADALTWTRGRVACKRRGCRKMILEGTVPTAKFQHERIKISGKNIDILRGDVRSRSVALGVVLGIENFVIDKECIHCCLKAAVACENPSILVVISPGARGS